MKAFGIFMMAASTLFMASCGADATNETEEQEEVAVAPITYTLDNEASSLEWKGGMSEEYFHTGSVSFSEGSLTMTDGNVTEGSFTIDMTSIASTDVNLEPGQAEYLNGHLTGTMVDDAHPVNMFFNTPAHPTVKVTLGEYTDGNLSVTLNILGQELTQDVAVTINSDDLSAGISGEFALDFASLGIPGFTPNPETGEGISPSVDFKLDLKLKK